MRRRFGTLVSLAAVVAATLIAGPVSRASTAAPEAWPLPIAGGASHDAFDFVHYGEGHHNEDGGPVVNGHIFRQTNRYGAAFLAFSSDMATQGNVAELQSFEDYIDEGYSPICPKAESVEPCFEPLAVPWYHSPGNHDREHLAGPKGVLSYRNAVYRQIFADNAGPWGEGLVPPGFAGERPAGAQGALTHYFVDYGPVRLIALDNSCHSISMCDTLTAMEQACAGQAACTGIGQNPPAGPGQRDASQWAFLERVASEAQRDGRLAFVFMHEPTRDPRYPANVAAISVNHTMNKGATNDNATFEAIAAATGVDGVLVGHIKGNATYSALGVPYYVDGGGGGAPYALSSAQVGVDWGYWYGYRLFRVRDGLVAGSWLVPVADRIELSEGGAPVSGSITVPAGTTLRLGATVVQPSCTRAPVCNGQTVRVELRRPRPPAGFESSVPAPAFVWHTSDRDVVRPSGLPSVEEGFDAATMSADGTFDAVAPGTAVVTVVTGWSRQTLVVNVV